MAEIQWVLTRDRLPQERVVVDTISPGGMQLRMSRIGSVWFPYGSDMYVYYTPILWREILEGV